MNQKRVLVVDDEAAFLLAIKKILHGPKLLIDTASTFEEAIALLDKLTFNVVITDIRLTDVLSKEGLEILKYVKGNKPGTTVIILTGYGNPEIMGKAYALGANVYLEKPVSAGILLNIIENQIVQHSR